MPMKSMAGAGILLVSGIVTTGVASAQDRPALRSALELEWDGDAVDLHRIAQNVVANDYLLQLLK